MSSLSGPAGADIAKALRIQNYQVRGIRMIRYKVAETSVVTDETLEQIINEWTARGWSYDGVQFAMREASKRPAMAFVFFTRAGDEGAGTTA